MFCGKTLTFVRRQTDESSEAPKRPKNAELVEQLIQEMDERAAEQQRAQQEEAAAVDARRQAGVQVALVPAAALATPLAAVQVDGASESRPIVRQWWFWTGAAVVVAAVAGGTAYAVSQRSNPGPAGSLKTIDAR